MTFLILGCFVVAALGIGIGIILLIMTTTNGQGVSDARQGWIEGTSFKEDE